MLPLVNLKIKGLSEGEAASIYLRSRNRDSGNTGAGRGPVFCLGDKARGSYERGRGTIASVGGRHSCWCRQCNVVMGISKNVFNVQPGSHPSCTYNVCFLVILADSPRVGEPCFSITKVCSTRQARWFLCLALWLHLKVAPLLSVIFSTCLQASSSPVAS